MWLLVMALLNMLDSGYLILYGLGSSKDTSSCVKFFCVMTPTLMEDFLLADIFTVVDGRAQCIVAV